VLRLDACAQLEQFSGGAAQLLSLINNNTLELKLQQHT
jgi:hypothetical protein